jgi:hypothetical protein
MLCVAVGEVEDEVLLDALKLGEPDEEVVELGEAVAVELGETVEDPDGVTAAVASAAVADARACTSAVDSARL